MKKLAIDDFGLVTLNANIALFKFNHLLGNDKEIYSFLTKLQIKHLLHLTGSLRFAYRIDYRTVEAF